MRVNFNFILCSVFTLLPNMLFFKHALLKKQISRNFSVYPNFILHDMGYNSSLYVTLNDLTLRQVANTLIEPSIRNQSTFKSDLLLQYLKKFRYNYRRYFFVKNKNYSNFLTDIELNTGAMQILYLLTGS